MSPLARIFYLLAIIAPVIGAGTIFFHFIEGWSWLDSYFFSVVTLSTVGYGELVPQTFLGKIGTTVYIFMGLGIFAFVIQQVGKITAHKRAQETEWFISRLIHHKKHQETGSTHKEGRPDHE